MDSEIQARIERNVWSLVPREEAPKMIGTQSVFTVKRNAKGEISTYKARLVALGNHQREGLDHTLFRIFMILFSCIMHWVNCLLGVRCAYLYGKIDKDTYIKQPESFEVKGKEDYVLKLNKSIYGLHQSGRCWYNDLHEKLLLNGFEEIKGITCAYNYKGRAIVLVYVDDLPIFAKSQEDLNEVINLIKSIYEVKELGDIHLLLGVEFARKDESLFNLNCSQYIEKCFKRFDLSFQNCNINLPSSPGYQPEPCNDDEVVSEKIPFRNLLGCLQYIAQRCRPDISWAVSSLSQFTERHNIGHFRALLRILMYLGTTKDLGLKLYSSEPPFLLTAYVDASWNSTKPDRKSWTGYVVFLNGMPVSWRVIKQKKVAMSPMESEYVAAGEAAKELKYLRMILTQISKAFSFEDFLIQKPILYMDNSAAITFITKPSVNVSTRYIDLDYHFVRDYYIQGEFDISQTPSKDNLADLLTKALPKDVFERLRSQFLH